MARLAKSDLLIIDDFGIHRLEEPQRLDMMEIVEDRHGLKSTLIAGQMPVAHWHEIIGEATLADAILDRLIHSTHRVQLAGKSLRNTQTKTTNFNPALCIPITLPATEKSEGLPRKKSSPCQNNFKAKI